MVLLIVTLVRSHPCLLITICNAFTDVTTIPLHQQATAVIVVLIPRHDPIICRYITGCDCFHCRTASLSPDARRSTERTKQRNSQASMEAKQAAHQKQVCRQLFDSCLHIMSAVQHPVCSFQAQQAWLLAGTAWCATPLDNCCDVSWSSYESQLGPC